MPDVTVTGLIPDRDYSLSVRATAGVEKSEWSPIVIFHTGTDKVAPAAPINFKVVSAGATFQATWEKPTHNEDGTTPVRDLRGYRITINPVGESQMITRDTTNLALELDYWQNRNGFGDVYKPNLEFRAYSVDLSGNISQTPAFVTAQKEPPPAPTNLTWIVKGDAFVADWDAPPPPADVVEYEITITNAGVSKVYYTTATAWELNRSTNAASFGIYKHTVAISVKSIDSARQRSLTGAEATATKAVPAMPTGLTFAAVGNDFHASWNPVTTDSLGGPLTDLSGYQVRLVNGATDRAFFTTDTKFALTYEENKSNFGTPRASFNIFVGARDSVNQIGAEATAFAENARPAAPTNLAGKAVNEGIQLTWTASVSDDVVGYEVWVANTSTETGILSGTVAAGSNSHIHQTVAYNQDHFLYLKAVDRFNSASDPSNRVGPFRPASPFSMDTTPPPATTVSGTTPSGRPASESAAIQVSWPASNADDLAGYHIRFSQNVTPRVWDFVDVFDNTATTFLVTGLRSATPYVFQIRSYDTSINTSAWSAESAPVTSTTSNVEISDIYNSITVRTGGNVKSEDYTIGGTAGWSLSNSTLDIQQGTVNARVIRAGELRSTANVTHDGTTQPMWSLNLAGNASINDVQVRGKMVVGNSAGTNNANVSIASHNYGGTGAQWAIKGDGTFDIKNGTGARVQFSSGGIQGFNGSITTFDLNTSGNLMVDGTIRASGGNFYGTVNVAGRLEVYGGDSYIIARRSGNGSWVMMDGRSNTDWAIDSSTGRFRVDYDGNMTCYNANISGIVTAASGNIAGWTIYADRLYSASGGVSIWNHGRIDGSHIYSGTVQASRVRSWNEPGAPNSWSLQSDIAYRVWNGQGHQQVYINMDGYAEFSNARITGHIQANSGAFNGTVNAWGGNFTGEVTGGTFVGGNFYSNYYGNNRVHIGPGSTDAYYSGLPGVRFNNPWGNYSGVAGDSRNLYMFAAEGSSARIHMSADAGEGGQIAFMTGSGTKMTITGNGVHLPSDRYLNFGFGLRQMLNLYGTNYGIGVQDYTLYFRTDNEFTWYRQGWHSNQQQNAGGGSRVMRLDWSGNLFTMGSYQGSSMRIKRNVVNLPAEKGLDIIKKIRTVQFERNDPGAIPGVFTGVIAEEIEPFLPELIGRDAAGDIEGVNYAGLTTYLIKAVQQISDRLDQIESRLPPRP